VGAGVAFDKIDSTAALPVCEQAARETDSSHFLFNYGRVLDAAKQYAKAAQEYGLAQARGHAVAALNLGNLYLNGQGVSRDAKQALALYKQAAQAGVALGATNAGFIYEFGGDGIARDAQEAVRWYTQAAQAGDGQGAYDLATHYEMGTGIARDWAEATKWYEFAETHGVPDGYAAEGLLWANASPPDISKAVALWKTGVAANSASSNLYMGWAFENGQGVNKAPSTAASFYSKAADLGNSEAMWHLGQLYWSGTGVKQDPQTAVRWFKSAADSGLVQGEVSLGYAYLTGLGIPRDYGQAASWLQKAATAGDQSAQVNLANLYESGLGVNKDHQRAQALYAQAAKGPDGQIAATARAKLAQAPATPAARASTTRTFGRDPATPTRASSSSSSSDSDWVAPVAIGLIALAVLAAASSNSSTASANSGSAPACDLQPDYQDPDYAYQSAYGDQHLIPPQPPMVWRCVP
jgi:TPR repeat protein